MNTRSVVKDSHLRAGCPICLHAVDVDHAAALQEKLIREQEEINGLRSLRLDLELMCGPA